MARGVVDADAEGHQVRPVHAGTHRGARLTNVLAPAPCLSVDRLAEGIAAQPNTQKSVMIRMADCRVPRRPDAGVR